MKKKLQSAMSLKKAQEGERPPSYSRTGSTLRKAHVLFSATIRILFLKPEITKVTCLVTYFSPTNILSNI